MRRVGSEEVAVLAQQFDVVVLGGGPAGYATALVRRGRRPRHRPRGGDAGRWHLPAPGLHPGQGAAPDGRGAAHHPARPRLRGRRRGAVARPRPVAGPQARGHRPPHQGPRVAAQGTQGHRVRPARRGRRRAPRTRCGSPTAPRSRAPTSSSPPGRTRVRSRASTSTARACCRPTTCSTSTELPARVAIIGGGVIGAEFASMLADMGSEVTIIEALPRILAPTDVDAGNVVARSFKKRGISVNTSARVTGIEGANELTVTWETDAGEQSVVVDKIIVSVGRAPRSGGIGLDELRRRDRRPRVRRRRRADAHRASTACSPPATWSTRPRSRTSGSPRRS